MVCSTPFRNLGLAASASLGLPELPIAILPHPFGSIEPDEARKLGELAARAAAAALLEEGSAEGEALLARGQWQEPPAYEAYLDVPADPAELTDFLFARGWGDGLPVIAPTPERVAAFVAASGWPADEVVGQVSPRNAQATVAIVAANAVMAGCRPEHMPVVLAGIEAIVRPSYNLYGIQATTGSVHPLMVVSGPLADRLGIHGGAGCLGPGFPANATIGRAIRMVMLNVGGAHPEEFDKATQGQPGKFTMCFAENQAGNPWPAYHVEMGFPADETVVLIASVMGTTDVHDYSSTNADELLRTMAASLSPPASNHAHTAGNSLLMICPEHAQTLAAGGLSRSDVQRELVARARVLLDTLGPVAREFIVRRRPSYFEEDRDRDWIPTFDDPEDLLIVVGGGAGKHSVFFPGFGGGKGTTEPQIAVVRAAAAASGDTSARSIDMLQRAPNGRQAMTVSMETDKGR
jgi:hypothetical protein